MYEDKLIRRIIDRGHKVDLSYPWEKWIEEEYSEPMPLESLIGVD